MKGSKPSKQDQLMRTSIDRENHMKRVFSASKFEAPSHAHFSTISQPRMNCAANAPLVLQYKEICYQNYCAPAN